MRLPKVDMTMPELMGGVVRQTDFDIELHLAGLQVYPRRVHLKCAITLTDCPS
jgi:hypothetical protein